MSDRHLNRDRVVIVGVWDNNATYYQESLDELGRLVKVAGGIVVGEMTQKLNRYNPASLIGTGKLKELKNFVKAEDIDIVIFDQALSGVQMRNIEEEVDCVVLDRTGLILDIFAQRAKTNEGKLQVFLAQLNYRLTHLIGMKNLSRLAGGIGTRGPGEQKLETDRRHIRRQMEHVKKELEQVKIQRSVERKQRVNSALPLVSLVGYTNSGKSSLMNRMIREGDSLGSEVYVRDIPFASLDSSLRHLRIPGELDILLSDTVGFISNLPTQLIDAFQSTLEEIKYADCIVHLVDGSREDIQLQYDTTWNILKELDVLDIPTILLINKLDLIDKTRLPLKHHGEDIIYLSIKYDNDLSEFYSLLTDKIKEEYIDVNLYFNYKQQAILDKLLTRYEATQLKYEHDGIYLDLSVSKADYSWLKEYERGKCV